MSLQRQTHHLYGALRGSSTAASHRQAESLSVGTTYRIATGPEAGAHYGFTAVPSGTFTAALTVWYSHLPEPREDQDVDWFQDTDIGTVTLTAGTTVGRLVGNVCSDFVRYRVVVATGTLGLTLFHRADRAVW
jgi:hypothetical protein